MKIWIAVAGLVTVLGCGEVSAMTGNELLQSCKNAASENPTKNASFTAGFCLGSMQSIGDLLTFVNAGLKPEARVCLPATVTNGQASRVVVKYLQDNPEKLHLNGTALVVMAIQKAFPCK